MAGLLEGIQTGSNLVAQAYGLRMQKKRDEASAKAEELRNEEEKRRYNLDYGLASRRQTTQESQFGMELDFQKEKQQDDNKRFDLTSALDKERVGLLFAQEKERVNQNAIENQRKKEEFELEKSRQNLANKVGVLKLFEGQEYDEAINPLIQTILDETESGLDVTKLGKKGLEFASEFAKIYEKATDKKSGKVNYELLQEAIPLLASKYGKLEEFKNVEAQVNTTRQQDIIQRTQEERLRGADPSMLKEKDKESLRLKERDQRIKYYQSIINTKDDLGETVAPPEEVENARNQLKVLFGTAIPMQKSNPLPLEKIGSPYVNIDKSKIKTSVPTKEEWIKNNLAANPNMTEESLSKIYDEKVLDIKSNKEGTFTGSKEEMRKILLEKDTEKKIKESEARKKVEQYKNSKGKSTLR